MTEEEEIFEEAEEAVEEEIEVPAPPPLKRARAKKEPAPKEPKAPKEDLKQRVECDDCGRQVSLHTLKYGKHRCPGKKEPKEPPQAKPAMTEKEATKPLKKKAVIQKAAKFQEQDEYMQGMLPPAQPENPWTQLQMQRQAQARLRAEATVSPYAQMFAAQRSRVM